MDLPVIISNLKKVKANLLEYMLESIDENEKEIRESLKRQMDLGVRGDGRPIRPFYSEAYKKRENKKNKTPDLKLTGKFRDNIYTEIAAFDVVITKSTRQEKGFDVANHLEERYTSKVLELTKSSIEKLKPKVIDKFYKKIQDEIYG